MLKREWSAESNCTYLIPGKTAALVPEFAFGRPAFGQNAALVPEFAVKDLPSSRIHRLIYIYILAVYPCFATVNLY